MSKKRRLLFGILLVTGACIIRMVLSAGHRLSISCDADRGIIDEVEDANLPTISNPRRLKKLLSAAEYRQALDTTQYYDQEQKRKWTWRARDYVVYDDSLVIAKRFSAKLVLLYDNALRDTANGDREYFFQIRTYTKDEKLIDQAEFATWSRAKQAYCAGVLTNDYFLIRSCDGTEEIKRINAAGHFIRPSKRTIFWLKVRGY